VFVLNQQHFKDKTFVFVRALLEAYLQYLGCEKIKLTNVEWEHSCNWFSAHGIRLHVQLGRFVLNQQYFKDKTFAFVRALLKNLKVLNYVKC